MPAIGRRRDPTQIAAIATAIDPGIGVQHLAPVARCGQPDAGIPSAPPG